MTKSDVLSKILFEAKSYNSIEDIEKLVEIGTDLSMIPIQPLYVSLLASSTDQVAEILPKLSKEQRQTLVDLDLWKKDHVDVESFEYWIEVYSKVQDLELIQGFVGSEDFLIYLKSRVNLHTFDTEDPMYPDHDYYFLTDDMLLLVEYSEEYRYPNELKYMIRNLYDRMGVEHAYTFLFKLINDSFSVIQETLYQRKIERLRDYGFVDYYEALEKTHNFITYKQIDSFILGKKRITPDIDIKAQNQSLHSSALVSFDSEMENILRELSLVKDTKRLNYLHFTFIRLINSTITLHDALKGGRVELTRIGKTSRNYLELGLQKVKTLKALGEGESVFSDYDFFDLYRIGKSLIQIEKNRIKKALQKTPFENDDYEYFLGAWWNSFLENSDYDIPKVKSYGAGLHSKQVNSLAVCDFWKADVTLFKTSIPFISSFFEMLMDLKKNGKLHDDFYMNYTVENIDFEAILISSFINFSLGHFSGNDVNKMGVSISELQKFFSLYFMKQGQEYILLPLSSEKVIKTINEFVMKFGFESILNFEKYLYGVLSEHLSGYEFDTLEEEDYKHIGGPILLNTLSKN
jgi:hypothetical protein